MSMDDKKKLRLKRIVTLISLIVIIGLSVWVTVFVITNFKEIRDAESFKEYILSFGAAGMLVGFLIQVLQVFIAFIPGEVIEIGLGFAYGAIRGTIICYLGLAAASALVFMLMKKFGVKAFELFFSMEKFNELKFVKKYIGNNKKLNHITFVLFLIPGTPKDVLTYFLGMTPMKLSDFLILTMIARIPSVLSSTVGGMLIHNRHYVSAIVLFAVMALFSLVGLGLYDVIKKHREEKNADRDTP